MKGKKFLSKLSTIVLSTVISGTVLSSCGNYQKVAFDGTVRDIDYKTSKSGKKFGDISYGGADSSLSFWIDYKGKSIKIEVYDSGLKNLITKEDVLAELYSKDKKIKLNFETWGNVVRLNSQHFFD